MGAENPLNQTPPAPIDGLPEASVKFCARSVCENGCLARGKRMLIIPGAGIAMSQEIQEKIYA